MFRFNALALVKTACGLLADVCNFCNTTMSPSCRELFPTFCGLKHSNYDSLSTTSVEKDSHDSDDSEESANASRTAPTDRQRWKSVITSLIIMFLIMFQNSMYFTNLWPYMKQIDPSATQSFYGIALMIAGLCLAVTSPLFGWWSSRIQSCKMPIFFGLTMIVISNLLVGLAESFPSNRKYVIMIGRMLSGIGCGSYAVLFGYIVMATKVEERRKAVSLRAAFITVAMFLGPAVSSAFVPIGFPGLVLGGWLHLNMYSSIAWLCVGICIVLFLVVGFSFQEYWITLDTTQKLNKQKSNKVNNKESHGLGMSIDPIKTSSIPAAAPLKLRPYDKVPMVVCWYLRFVYMFMIAIDRAIGTAFIMIMFKWTPAEAISYSAIIQLCTCAIEFSGNLIMGNVVLKYVREKNVMIIGLAIGLLYFVFSFSWPGLPPMTDGNDVNDVDGGRHLPLDTDGGGRRWTGNISDNYSSTYSMAIAAALSTTTAGVSNFANLSGATTIAPPVDLTECNYDWCPYTTRVQLWQYVLSRLFLALSILTGFTPTSTLMSKVIGPRKQGVQQGLFAGCGQIGTTLSPLIMGTVFEYLGPRVAFAIGAAINCSALLLVGVTFKRLVAWRDYSEEERKCIDLLNESAPLLDQDYDRRDSLLYGS